MNVGVITLKTMQIHQIKPSHRPRAKTRIGRGGKRGTYSGKGQKGQKSRAGAKIRSEQKEAILKIPKRRGVKFKNSPKKTKHPVVAVNLSGVERFFKNSELVNPRSLLAHGLIEKISGKYPRVKILVGQDKLAKKLYFSEVDVSSKAKELIEKAGGAIK